MLQTQIMMFGSDQIQHDVAGTRGFVTTLSFRMVVKTLLRSGVRVQQKSDESLMENLRWVEEAHIQCVEKPAYIPGTQEGRRLSGLAAQRLHA